MRVTEFKKARAAANETASDMEIDAQDNQPAGEDLYSRLKLCQRQQEFNEIQVGQISNPKAAFWARSFSSLGISSAGETYRNGIENHQNQPFCDHRGKKSTHKCMPLTIKTS